MVIAAAVRPREDARAGSDVDGTAATMPLPVRVTVLDSSSR